MKSSRIFFLSIISILSTSFSFMAIAGNGSGGGSKNFVVFERASDSIAEIHGSIYLGKGENPHFIVYVARDVDHQGGCSMRQTFSSRRCSVETLELSPTELSFDQETQNVLFDGQVIGRKSHSFLGLNDRWIKLDGGVALEGNARKSTEDNGEKLYTLELTLKDVEE